MYLIYMPVYQYQVGRKPHKEKRCIVLSVLCVHNHHVLLHLVSPQRSVVKQVTSFSCCMGFNMIYKDPPNAFDFFLQFQSKEFLCTAQVIDSAAKP